MAMTPKDVIEMAKSVKMVDLRFIDLPGTWQHFTIPAHRLTEDLFEDGLPFDGSSIRGFQEIHESDMLLQLVPDSAFIDPIFEIPTLVMICDVYDIVTRQPYSRDPRYVARKAEAYAKQTGIADTVFFGPEAEFFLFNDVRYGGGTNSSFYYTDSAEGWWNSGEALKPNMGAQIQPKRGYFPVPPMDTLQDVRSKIVRGAPYSAESTTETIQPLADGNRIVRRSTIRVFRDSEGRTREERINADGVVTGINISDPVSGESFMLNPATRTAFRGGVITVTTAAGSLVTAGPSGLVYSIEQGSGALDAAKRQQIEDQARLTTSGGVRGSTVVVTQGGVGGQALDEAKKREIEQRVQAGAGVKYVAEGASLGQVTKEDLGQQVIEGVTATGTRTTTVIETGAIGNEQPIQVVSEQWYSPDLQTLLLTRHSDPRTGETTFRLAGIVRAEPDRSLFTLPPDYTVLGSAIRRESR